jgi:hypothetical protein
MFRDDLQLFTYKTRYSNTQVECVLQLGQVTF